MPESRRKPRLDIYVVRRKGHLFFAYKPDPNVDEEQLSPFLHAPHKTLGERLTVTRDERVVQNLQIQADWHGTTATFVDTDKKINLSGNSYRYQEVGERLEPEYFKEGDRIRVTATLNYSVPGEAYEPWNKFPVEMWRLIAYDPGGARSRVYNEIYLVQSW